MASKPVVLPEPFDGESSWEDWQLHFQNVAIVNGWTDEQKLQWLRVHLTGRAQRTFHRLPEASRASYEDATAALQERFEPTSRKTRYQAEFETRRKKKSEGWADFADDLRSLADKAFPDLQLEARECLAVRAYLQQLEQPQVAFSVKQSGPKTLDEAVAATLEMESYVPLFPRTATVSSLQEERTKAEEIENKDSAGVAAINPTATLTTMLEKLMERVEILEARHSSPERKQQQEGRGATSQKPRRRFSAGWQRREFTGICWNCQQPGHIARNCRQSRSTLPENY